MEIADAHRVGVAERPDADLRRGRPDPGTAVSRGSLGEWQVVILSNPPPAT